MQSVTIVIPTYNRPQHLARALYFLQELKNPYLVVVLDSSEPNIQMTNQEMCKATKAVHKNFSKGIHLGQKITRCMNEYITTPYIIFCADDDFIIPQTISKSALFLEENPDYSAVTGIVKCLAYPQRYNRLGLFTFLDHLKNPLNLDENTFLARYLKLIACYSMGCPPLFYALRRSSHVRDIFNLIPPEFKYSSIELLNNMLTVLWGKSITVPLLMLIRNYSSKPTEDAYRQDDDYYTCTQDALVIRAVLSKELKKIDNNLSDELIDYTLDQFIKIPLKKMSDSYKTPEIRTELAVKLGYKLNWFFYGVNFLFPFLLEKFDTTLQKPVIRALKKTFSN